VLGKRLQLLGDRQATREIVGVVGNVSHIALGEPDWPEMYVPYSQDAPPTINIVVRAAANPMNLSAALRDQANAVDKDVTLSAMTSMDDVLGASVSQPRFSSQLLGVFAAVALLLATIGLYGLMAYSITERRNEIGIRMALGAQRRDILRIVLGEGGKMVSMGIALGLVASLALTRLMTRMLFGVSPTDPLTFVAVVVILLGVAMLACWIPARRAMRVDPMVALRHE
jgi:ABC-type antimicrobial peptide transport system permease subunit